MQNGVPRPRLQLSWPAVGRRAPAGRCRAAALRVLAGGSRERLPEATCLTEMSVMMACWKQNDFNDKACAEEIRTFYDCVARAEKERKEKKDEYTLSHKGNMPSSTVNRLLRRFPNITRYV
uniref:Coiled-coil-helix-coiled-coil-helix domain containing 1 n=1 Tax=Meleagris gallopavo TaxID=9103 RepID=A0A803YQ77_MELGA